MAFEVPGAIRAKLAERDDVIEKEVSIAGRGAGRVCAGLGATEPGRGRGATRSRTAAERRGDERHGGAGRGGR